MPKAGERLPVSHTRPDAWHRPLAIDGLALVADSRCALTLYVARCDLRELQDGHPRAQHLSALQRVELIDGGGSHIANGPSQAAVASIDSLPVDLPSAYTTCYSFCTIKFSAAPVAVRRDKSQDRRLRATSLCLQQSPTPNSVSSKPQRHHSREASK